MLTLLPLFHPQLCVDKKIGAATREGFIDVQDQVSFLQQIIYKLKPNGKLVIIEYDMDKENPWVPYPISFERLKKIVQNVELTEPIELNRKSSVYNSEGMYLALCQKK